MNKTTGHVFELVGLILSLVGIVQLFGSAGEVIYRQPPLSGFMFQDVAFLQMLRNENDPQFLERLLTIDLNFMMDKQPDPLLNELTRIIDAYPDYIPAYLYRGQIYLSAGRVEQGIRDMQVVRERADDIALRNQAGREIVLARLAQVLTPIPFLGLAAGAVIFISSWAGKKLISSRRSIMIFIASCIVWAGSFFFLLLH